MIPPPLYLVKLRFRAPRSGSVLRSCRHKPVSPIVVTGCSPLEKRRHRRTRSRCRDTFRLFQHFCV